MKTNYDNMQDYIEGTPMWYVYLDNNVVVLRDDRELNRWSSWLELKEHLSKNDIKIHHIKYGFRDNVFFTPENAKHYYLSQGMRGYSNGHIIHMWNIGWSYDGKTFHMKKYIVPEFLEDESYETNVANLLSACII